MSPFGSPWSLAAGVDGSFAVENVNGFVVCSRSPWIFRAEESLAHGRLIAAAPELLEAVTKLANEASALSAFELEIREVIGNTNWTVLQLRISEAKAALAKAAPRY